MKTKDYIIFLLIVLVGVCSSCSLQKRHYREGYYVENKGGEQTSNKNSSISYSDSSKGKDISLNKNSKHEHDCDTLILNDGNTLLCKIDEVTKRSVRFKDCNDSNQTSNSIDAELISSIKFYNGRVKPVSKKESNNNQNNPKNNNTLIKGGLVNTGFILAILALLLEGTLILTLFHVLLLATYIVIPLAVLNILAAILAITFGFSSIREIRKNPDIFKGKKMATWGIILGLLSLASWLIILIAITII